MQKRNKSVAFKNNASLITCISKANGVKIDNAEDLDVEMPMYNLLEYSKNHKKTTGSLWDYYRDEPSNPNNTDNRDSFPHYYVPNIEIEIKDFNVLIDGHFFF